MTAESLSEKRNEFQSHVWDHSKDEFQIAFNTRERLTKAEQQLLMEVLNSMANGATDSEMVEILEELLAPKPDDILILMQIVGLTRNKIVQDLKPGLRKIGISVPGSAPLMINRPRIWAEAGQYLVTHLRRVLTPLFSAKDDVLVGVFEALNQATWPCWIRQERAKRSGHEAEGRLAVLLQSLDLDFEPKEKATNPLCPDAKVCDVSFDIVVPTVAAPKLCVKATVHTANIGQFGESKDKLEIQVASQQLENMEPKPTLLAFIDGVGFDSNRAGLDGVLEHADEFCQFSTLWKAAVLAARAQDMGILLVLPDRESHLSFLRRHNEHICLVDKPDQSTKWIAVGEAQVRLDS